MAYDKVIDSAELEADLTSVADAIRAKGGTTEALSFPDGFVSAVEGISAGGGGDDGAVARSIIQRNITEYSDNIMTGWLQGGLAGIKTLTYLSIPNITGIAGDALKGCTALETVDFRNLTTVSQNCFYGCSSLRNLTIGPIKQLERQIFYGCAFEEFISPSVTHCNQAGSFRANTALKRVHLPNLSSITTNSTSIFNGCSALEEVDYGSGVAIRDFVFENCSSLRTLILRKSTVTTLDNVDAFTGCSNVTIYCPSTLISEYQQATNWSTLYTAGTCNFVAIEGSEYE